MENNEYGTGRKDWMEIFEPSGSDGTLRSNNSVFTPPASVKVKGRNFKGATTKNAYGPANAPKVTSGGGFTDYGTGDSVSTMGGAMGDGGGAGGGMGESIDTRFVAFLESMTSDTNIEFMNTLKSGFDMISGTKEA